MKQKRKIGKKIAAWFMCLAMVLSMVNLPGFTTTAHAAGEKPIQSLRIDGKWYSTDSSDISKGATDLTSILSNPQSTSNGGSWECYYNSTTKKFTIDLENYSGDAITIVAGNGQANCVDIYYTGTNTIGLSSSLYGISCDLPLELYAKSTGLKHTLNLRGTGYGIYLVDDWDDGYSSEKNISLTMAGYSNVNIDVSDGGVSNPYGIYVATKQDGVINRTRTSDKVTISEINLRINVLSGGGIFANNLTLTNSDYIIIHTEKGNTLDLMSVPSTNIEPQLNTEHNYCYAINKYIAVENSDYTVSLLEDRDCFKVQPSFTPINHEKGNINLTLNEKIKITNKRLVKDGETATDVFATTHQGVFFDNTWYNGDGVYSVPEGSYKVALEVNGNWYYSNTFVIKYPDAPEVPEVPVVSGTFTKQPKNITMIPWYDAKISFVFDGDIDNTYPSTLMYKNGSTWQDLNYVTPQSGKIYNLTILAEKNPVSKVFRIAVFSKGTWVFSDEFTVTWKYINYDFDFDETNGVLTITGNGAMPNMDYQDLPWYDKQDQIKKVVIGDGITSIPSMAFFGCSNLEEVTLPSTLQSVSSGAFWGTAIEAIDIPEGVTEIDDMAFSICDNLRAIGIPSTVTSIGAFALSVSEPEKVTVIYNGSKEDLEKISIDSNNNILTDGKIIYTKTSHVHTGGTATCTKKAVCEICGEEYGEVNPGNHDSSEQPYQVDEDGKHYQKCKDCGAESTHEAHTGGTTTCTAKAKCSTCGTEYGSLAGHTYDTKWSTDGTNHWHACTVCGNKKDSAAHTLKTTTVTKATTTNNGKQETKCTVCNKVTKTATIYAAKTIKLSATTYTYDGKVKKPSVTVKNSAGTTLKKDTAYTVTYASGRKAVGKYKVTIKGKGKYSFTKTLTFKINPVKTSISSLTKGTKSFTVKWAKKTTQTTGYEIQYSTSSTFKAGTATKKVTVTSNKTTSKTIKSLKAKQKYYVRVRTYKTVNGTKYYSAWCTKKYVTTK